MIARLSGEVSRFIAAIVGTKEGFTRRAVVDEGIALERLVWVARHDWLYETLRLRGYPDHVIARVLVQRDLDRLDREVLRLYCEWVGPPIVRVSGDATCDCGRTYRRHPYAVQPQHLYEPVPGYGAQPFLHRGCDGALYKL